MGIFVTYWLGNKGMLEFDQPMRNYIFHQYNIVSDKHSYWLLQFLVLMRKKRPNPINITLKLNPIHWNKWPRFLQWFF